MIKGFEHITRDLEPKEREVVFCVVEILKERKGKGQAITNKQISQIVARVTGTKLSPPRMRKIINLIRVRGILPGIIGWNTGYFLAQEEEEWRDGMIGLQDRIEAITAVYDAMVKGYGEFLDEKKRAREEKERGGGGKPLTLF